jgi:uncharacterized membrane protein YgaE (UPF0421/DUF939 family)
VAAADHAFLVIAMLIGALIGMFSSMMVMDKTVRGQLVSILVLPAPLIGMLSLGLFIGGYRIAALVTLPVIAAIGTYLRRFGPRGFIVGILLFVGDFVGFFMHGVLTLGDLWWVTAEVGVGVAVAIAVRFALFYPREARALQRTQHSYAARARKVAALALELLETPRHTARDARHYARDARRLHHQLIRLNEAALMIDAQLADPGAAADGSSAQLLHQRLFDAELALSTIARFAQAMAGFRLPAPQHFEARLALRDLIRGDNQTARTHAARLTALLREAGPVPSGDDRALMVAHRFAGSVIDLADALTEWEAVGATREGEAAFQPPVQLLGGGQLPGSAIVSGAASLEPGTRLADRIRLPSYNRAAIQLCVAVGVATAFGDLLSGRRFYWAVVAAFVTLMGTNNTREQVRKAFFRIVGTAVGIVVGSLLVTGVGHHPYWSIVVILAALFFGFYLNQISYAVTVLGLTVTASQLYEQLGEFSNSLLVLRLEETALGAAVAMAVVMLVLPLRTRRVLQIALRGLVRPVGRLAGHASDHLQGEDHDSATTLRSDARAVDAAYQALVATAQLVRRTPSGSPDEDVSQALQLGSAARYYSRDLVADTERAGLPDAGTRLDIELATAALRRSLDAIAVALTGSKDGTYTRSAALFDQAERRIEDCSDIASPAQLAIRDFMLIDATFAEMAEALGLPVADCGPAPAAPAAPAGSGGTRIRGRVRGPDGAGVQAALTLITRQGRQAARAAADAEGAYWLDAPSAGQYVLLASARSHLPAASGVTVREPARGGETVVNVLLATTSGLAGTVTAASSGSPVAGAGVTLTDPLGMVTGARRTGPDGGYSFNGLKSGEYVLAVSAGHYRPEARTVTVSDSGEARADVGLAADTCLSGVVVTIDGTRPVPGARVTLLDDTGAVAAAADTDQAGRYTIEGLASGEYTAIISGYPPTASTLHIPGPAGTVWRDSRLRHPQAASHSTDQQVAGQD